MGTSIKLKRSDTARAVLDQPPVLQDRQLIVSSAAQKTRDEPTPLSLISGSPSPALLGDFAGVDEHGASALFRLNAPQGPILNERECERSQTRYRILEPILHPERFERLWEEHGGQRGALIKALCEEHRVSRSCLYSWLEAWEANGLAGLARKGRSDVGRPRVLNTAALEFIVSAALPEKGMSGRLSAKEIFRAYGEEREWRQNHLGKRLGAFEEAKYVRHVDALGRLAASAVLPVVSYDTIRHWCNQIPQFVRTYAKGGPEAFSKTQEILSYRAIDRLQPLEYVVMDHRVLDLFAMARRPGGGWNLVRPWLTAALDMRTRKWLAWVIVEIPSSDSIAVVLKRVFLTHGLPGALYWDNGKDYTCQYFEGPQARSRTAPRIGDLGGKWSGVLDALSIRVHHAIPYRPRAKLIEPNFRNTAEFDKTLPWWCGNRPEARPYEFEELVRQHESWLRGEGTEPVFPSIEELAGLYDGFLATLNEREHSGQGMRKTTPTGYGWMSPNECWNKLIGRVERRCVPADVLQFAFNKRKKLSVRNGEVQVSAAGRLYHYRLVHNAAELMRLNGCEIEIGYDPSDLGTVTIYDQDRFVGFACDLELRRMGEQDFVVDERKRRSSRRAVRRAIDAAHRTYVPGQAERLARRQPVVPSRQEADRPEVTAPVRSDVIVAAQAARADSDFKFSDAVRETDLARSEYPNAGGDDEEGAFDFFSKANDD